MSRSLLLVCSAAVATLGVASPGCSLIASVDRTLADDEPAGSGPGGAGGAAPGSSACRHHDECSAGYHCSGGVCEYCAPGTACSEFELTGPLRQPDQVVPFVVDCADFWLAARDDQQGGFHSFVEQDGSPQLDSDGAPFDKSIVGQSRLGYGFVRAYMLTGDERYLEHAEHALEFVYEHGWDAKNDGFHFFTSADGEVPRDGQSSAKWSYVQHYGLLGPTAMCEATHDPKHCGWMEKGIASLDEHLWDDRPGMEGYFDEANEDFSVVSGKGFTPTADAITTHALSAYLITGRADYRDRFLALSDQLVEHLVASRDDPAVVFGFAERFTSDWDRLPDTFGFVGHVYKAAWSLARAYMLEPKVEYREAAEELLSHLYDDGGFDQVVGAPNNAFHWDAGLQSRTKEYWQVEQGFTAGTTNFFIAARAGDNESAARHLEVGSRSLDFLLTKMVDPTYGEIFSLASADGERIIDPTKGGRWKAGYHSIESGYLAYLYGKLMVHRRPAVLHYRIVPADTARQLSLVPLAYPKGKLVIQSVVLNDNDHDDFERERLLVNLSPDQGGALRVTFAPAVPSSD